MSSIGDRVAEDWGRDLCESLGLDPSVVIASTLSLRREGDSKGNVRAWVEYRQMVDGSPERDGDGILVTHTIPASADTRGPRSPEATR